MWAIKCSWVLPAVTLSSMIVDDMEQASEDSDLNFLGIYQAFNMHVTLTRCLEIVDCRVGIYKDRYILKTPLKSWNITLLQTVRSKKCQELKENNFPTLSRCMTNRCDWLTQSDKAPRYLSTRDDHRSYSTAVCSKLFRRSHKKIN